MQFASAVTQVLDAPTAIDALAEQVHAQLGSQSIDLAVVFMSPHYGPAAQQVAERLHDSLHPRVLLGCTAEGVIGSQHEIEGVPAITLLAAHWPDATLTPFSLETLSDDTVLSADEFKTLVGATDTTRLVLLLADPFSTPPDVLHVFNQVYPGLPVIGGMASGAQQPGGNALLLDDLLLPSGAVGVCLGGDFSVDIIVSQGCRPIGAPLAVTQATRNILLTLDGETPSVQFRRILNELPITDRVLLQNGLFIGRAIAQTDTLGRGDFLIRGVIGVDRESGAMAVGDMVHAGETVQFHVRDQATAEEDLQMLLFPQTFDTPPAGALLFSCNGRGTRLYEHPDGDISIIQGALGEVHLAGFFCAGEIGPVGGQNFLHGHTASLVLFRDRIIDQ